MKSFLFALLTLCLLAMPVNAATLQANKDAQFNLNQASPEAMRKHQLGTLVVDHQVRVLKGLYDFALQGGAIGTVNLKNPSNTTQNVVLPNKALIVGCYIDVQTTGATSASGTIALGTGQSGADLKAATAATSYTGIVACIPTGTAASAIKLTADRTMTATIATGAITAGKFVVMIQYILGDN